MRLHYFTALLLAAPFALYAGGGRLSAQDTTQAQKQNQQRDSTSQQYPQSNMQQQQNQSQLSDEQVVMRMHRTNQMEIRAGKLAQSRGSSSKVKSLGSRLVRDHQANDQKVVALAKQLNITLPRDGMDSTGNEYQRNQSRDRWQKSDSSRSRMDTTQRNDSTYSSYPRSNPTDTTQNQGRFGQSADSTQSQYGQGRAAQQGQYGQQDSTQDNMKETMRQLQTLRGAAFDTAFANAMVQGHNKAINMLEQAQNQVQRQELRTLIASTLPTLRQHLQLAQQLTTGATTTSSR